MVAYGKLNSSVVPKQRPLIPIFRVSRIYFPNFRCIFLSISEDCYKIYQKIDRKAGVLLLMTNITALK